MRERIASSICFVYILTLITLISCSSTENRTEERAKERVAQFLRLMSENRLEEAEKLLSRYLSENETKELFLDSYDNWHLKGPDIVIQTEDVIPNEQHDKNKAMVSFTIRNEKINFTRQGTLPVKFERGDWYIGG